MSGKREQAEINDLPIPPEKHAKKDTPMSPKATDIMNQATINDKKFINGIMDKNLDLMGQEIRDQVNEKQRIFLSNLHHNFIPIFLFLLKIDEIFDGLDGDKNGVLEKDDFQHSYKAIDEKLKEVWKQLEYHFDYDGDGKISKDEFYGYFIIQTLFFSANESIPGTSLAAQLTNWEGKYFLICIILSNKLIGFSLSSCIQCVIR